MRRRRQQHGRTVVDAAGVRVAVRGVVDGTTAKCNGLIVRQVIAVAAPCNSPSTITHAQPSAATQASPVPKIGSQHTPRVAMITTGKGGDVLGVQHAIRVCGAGADAEVRHRVRGVQARAVIVDIVQLRALHRRSTAQHGTPPEAGHTLRCSWQRTVLSQPVTMVPCTGRHNNNHVPLKPTAQRGNSGEAPQRGRSPCTAPACLQAAWRRPPRRCAPCAGARTGDTSYPASAPSTGSPQRRQPWSQAGTG